MEVRSNNVQLSPIEILVFDVIRQAGFHFKAVRAIAGAFSRLQREANRNERNLIATLKINCIKIAIDCSCSLMKDRKVNTEHTRAKNHRRLTDRLSRVAVATVFKNQYY